VRLDINRIATTAAVGLALTAASSWSPAVAGAASSELRPAHASGPLGNELLSDEQTLTRYAHPYTTAKIRSRPSNHGRTLARLHYHTEDGPLEVYLVLRSRVVSKATWLQLRIPGRPNGRTGWVREEALGPLVVVRTALRINRTTLRATLYRDGKKIWQSPVGVGKPSTPTPAGRFWIRERLKALGAVYGPWAFGTSAYSILSDWPGGGVVGIHGTNEPELIPGRPSHGCIRMPNAKIERLARLMPVGTPVRIV
jgi:lipoprotein-anchoring transpeptidase ErfK/SrfK